jgi:hypothetical protein
MRWPNARTAPRAFQRCDFERLRARSCTSHAQRCNTPPEFCVWGCVERQWNGWMQLAHLRQVCARKTRPCCPHHAQGITLSTNKVLTSVYRGVSCATAAAAACRRPHRSPPDSVPCSPWLPSHAAAAAVNLTAGLLEQVRIADGLLCGAELCCMQQAGLMCVSSRTPKAPVCNPCRKNSRWQASLNNMGHYIYLGSYKTQVRASGPCGSMVFGLVA